MKKVMKFSMFLMAVGLKPRDGESIKFSLGYVNFFYFV